MDILTRNVPDAIAIALETHARAAGMTRNDWIIEQWKKLVEQPIVKERYAFRVYGQSGKGLIRRLGSHPNETGSAFTDFSQEEADAIHKAEDLLRRNSPGDREEALYLLKKTFNDVFEVPV